MLQVMSTGLTEALGTRMRAMTVPEGLVTIIWQPGSVPLTHDWPTYQSNFVYQDIPVYPCLELSSGTQKTSFYEEAAHFPAGDSQNRPCDQHSELHQIWESPCPQTRPMVVSVPKLRDSHFGEYSGTISVEISRSSMKEQQRYGGSAG